MQQPGIQMKKTFLVREENLRPVVGKYLEKISEAQWQLLAAGTIDFDTQTIILDMITEIIQTLSADILRVFLPLFQQYLTKNLNQAASTEVEIKTDLGDAFSTSFSQALNVALENNGDAEELTKLAEEEIEEKVNSLLNVVTETQLLPPDSSVYVSGFTSNVKRLGRMVCLTVRCLRSCIVRLNTTSMTTGFKYNRFEPKKSPNSIKSKISVASATESIEDILRKWAPSRTQEDENVPPSLTPSCTEVAAEILSTIHENLESVSLSPVAEAETKLLHKPGLNLTSAVNKLRSYFGKRSTNQEVIAAGVTETQRCKFSGFVKRKFNKMMEELKKSRKTKGKRFFVNINSRRAITTQQEYETTLPGCVPETPRAERSAKDSKMIAVDVVKGEPITINNIKSDVENFIDKMIRSGKIAELRQKLENIKDCDEVQMFSRELLDKIYGHLVNGEVYKRPIVPTGKSLSDNILPKIKGTKHGNQMEVAFEELYAMTEDVVGRFLQQIFLCLLNEQWEEVIHNEGVSGALSEITNLIKEMIGSQEEEDTTLGSTADIERLSTSRSSLSSVAAPAGAIEPIGEEVDDRHLKRETVKDEKTVSKSSVAPDTSSDSWSKETTYPSHTESSPSMPPWTGNVDVTESVEKASSECQINHLITALLLRLLSKYKREGGKSLLVGEMDEIIKRLSHILMVEVDMDDRTLMIMEENMQDLVKVLVRYIFKKFGSREEVLLLAVIEPDSSFDYTILKCLKKELCIRREAKKKGRIVRFFSAIGNILKRPVLAMIRKVS